MEEKINLVEILKDCPKGMELDCILFNNPVKYECIVTDDDIYPIRILIENDIYFYFTKEGYLYNIPNSKCLIFPKGKDSWEGFQRPFKDGDIVVTNLGSIAIISNKLNNEFYNTHCLLCGCYMIRNVYTCVERLATEEEKQKLFQAIKDNDYKWNEETKTLEKLFKPKFKDGDIITDSLGTCIFKGEGEGDFEGYVNFYCGISYGCFSVKDEKHNPNGHYGLIVNYRLSTEEEKAKFFQAIKDNGYKWNEETKTLEKLVEPKFKVGDKIRLKNNRHITDVIIDIVDNQYVLSSCGQKYLNFKYQDKFELVSKKFDFSTLIPFESKVLVRDTNTDYWLPDVYGGRNEFNCFLALYKERSFYKCIPYEGNEHLLGTTNDCDSFYKI